MGLLSTQPKKPGLLANVPVDYRGTLGELPILSPLSPTRTSTQAIPDENTLNAPLGFARGVARGFAATAGELSAVPGRLADVARGRMPAVPFGETQFPLRNDRINRSIFGNVDQPISFRAMGALPGVPETGPVAPLIGAIFGGLDLTGAGQGLRGLKGLTGALKSAKTAEQAARLMKGAGFTDDIIKDYSRLFAKSTDAVEIEKGLLSAEKLQNTTKVAAVPQVLEPIAAKASQLSKEDFIAQFEQGLKAQNLTVRDTAQNTLRAMSDAGYDSAADFYAAVKVKTPSPASSAIAKGLTEDEFVKGQGTPLFRGGSLREAAGGEQDFGQGFYFADSKKTASGYGDVENYSVSIKNPYTVKDRYEMNSVWDEFISTKPSEKTTLRDWLKGKGYDGIIIKDGGMGGEKGVGGFKVAFDKSQIKTTSQLRAEYQAAKKK